MLSLRLELGTKVKAAEISTAFTLKSTLWSQNDFPQPYRTHLTGDKNEKSQEVHEAKHSRHHPTGKKKMLLTVGSQKEL